MNTKIEILNYLNLINERLGKNYKLNGFSPLPNNFVFSEEKIKEIIELKKLNNEIKIPEFFYANKKEIKKYLKNSEKNIKKILKITEKTEKFDDFSEKLNIYLAIRLSLTHMFLKDFNKHDFNEISMYKELFELNPIFGELFENIYFEDFDISVLENIEEKYSKAYLQKIKTREKIKAKKSIKEIEQIAMQTIEKKKKTQIINEKVEKTQKKVQKLKNL